MPDVTKRLFDDDMESDMESEKNLSQSDDDGDEMQRLDLMITRSMMKC